MTDTPTPTKTAYEVKKHYITAYYKKRYENDTKFRKKENIRSSSNNRNRYNNDPEYRLKCKENVKLYRQKMKQLDNDLKQITIFKIPSIDT